MRVQKFVHGYFKFIWNISLNFLSASAPLWPNILLEISINLCIMSVLTSYALRFRRIVPRLQLRMAFREDTHTKLCSSSLVKTPF